MKAKIECVCGKTHLVSPGETKTCTCGLQVRMTEEKSDGTFYYDNVRPDGVPFPKFKHPRPLFKGWKQ